MFNIESYITPILLSYVDKYVRDFKPADAQVSLWAGGVTLHNLVLKADVLQSEVALPFTLVSGRIHELLIQVPWTKIMSEPIVVTINTIECILSLNPPPEESPPQETNSRTQVVEAPPGYMQALVRRIVSNIAIRVHSLIVKYVHDDIVLSLNVKKLSIDSVGTDWEPAFADIDQTYPAIRRLVRLDDLTLCLDKSDSDGKIRFYHEPLLYRCQLDLRVLTKLVSANTRRAKSLSVQLRSSRLAWGVNNEQMVLLLRLLRERTLLEDNSPPPAPKQANAQVTPLHATSSNTAEPARSESWSQWAWSWLPAWDREGVAEAHAPASPAPLALTAHLAHVSLVCKIIENDSNRKRARGVLELTATDAVIKSSVCSPTHLRIKMGARELTLSSHGKCVCGHLDAQGMNDESTVYLSRIPSENEEPWSWQEEDLNEHLVETAVVADEELRESMETPQEPTEGPTVVSYSQEIPAQEEVDDFWEKMAPVIFFDYSHDRSPNDVFTNPFDNPPRDFEYSDWVEDCKLKIVIRPLLILVSTGLLHRLTVIKNVLQEVPPLAEPDVAMRTLTVEECEALSENLPQRRIDIDVCELRVRVAAWEHSQERAPPPVALALTVPSANFLVTMPLYPHRVCSAACQIPSDSGALWQGARVHISASASLQAGVCAADEPPRACARAEIRFVTHTLLNSSLFTRRESVHFSYTIKIREANLSGSAARLQAAWQVMSSLINEKTSIALKHTTLAKDALSDEDMVAIDVTLEELSLRGYITKNTKTHILTMHSARATAFHSPIGGELKQAWLFSAPEAPTTSPYLRMAVQWCSAAGAAPEYAGVWVEPTAVSADPLLLAWLGYRPQLRLTPDSLPHISSVKSMTSSQFMLRRRTTPPSSSGRGASRSGSGAELVHVRPRSVESSSERSERKEPKPAPQVAKAPEPWLSSESLLKLHERLDRLLLTAEVGLVLVYVASGTASALDCATVRDAMERHAATRRVLVTSLGRLSMHSNSQMKHLWQEIRHDGPTFLKPEQNLTLEESFPWKIRLTDVSCYTLEVRPGTERSGRDKSSSGLRSQLKASRNATPKTVLEMVTTTVTLSVVTKTLQIKTALRRPDAKVKHSEHKEEDKTKYFTTGMDFKPASLKEFVRGPLKRKKVNTEPETKDPPPEPVPAQTKVTNGPVISLGVNLHADTPPVVIRLDQDQVQCVAIAIHCLAHIMKLLNRPPLNIPKQGFSSFGSSHRSLVRSVSELEAKSLSEDTSENPSEQLISIFEAHPNLDLDRKLKTFFWFQWVVSRVTLVVATPQLKLAFDIDDIITSADLQDHYNQLKIKVASASVRHYKRTSSDEWMAGVLGGRILEVREPGNAKEENHFLAVTITQARISNLPVSWKEELHPKLLEQNANIDSMWEVYATLAPLEAVLLPDVLDHIISWLAEISPPALCSLESDTNSGSTWQWPFCYVSAGGLRLLLTHGEENESTGDDTFMLVIGKVSVNPHPENPICRRAVNAGTETGWGGPGPGLEGRQYEVLIKNLALRSARFSQLVNEEANESEILKGTGGENPALKWSQPVVSPTITPILHTVDLGCVLAPAMYQNDVVWCGPAIELNLVSDCAIELAVERLELARLLAARFLHAFRHRTSSSMMLDDEDDVCPYAALLTNQNLPDSSESENILHEEVTKSTIDISHSFVVDSGIETATSQSTYKLRRDPSVPLKKTVSIACIDRTAKASDFLEVFVTMGVIDISLYVGDDGSQDVRDLRPPPGVYTVASEPLLKVVIDETKDVKVDEGKDSMNASKSLTETVRNVDIGKTKLEQLQTLPLARKSEGNIPLIHVTLHQPNLYYWKRKKQKTIQVSLFNVWAGLGAGSEEGQWNAPLLTTARGTADPLTDIPPALVTLRVDLTATGGYVSMSGASGKGVVQLDVERPVLFEVSTDRLRRLKGILALVKNNLTRDNIKIAGGSTSPPILYKLRHYMVNHHIESMVVQTGQIGLRGSEGTIGCGGIKVQVGEGGRPDRLRCRALVTAALIAAGPDTDRRHVVLHPMMAGAVLDATWEAWRRAEGGPSAHEPTVRVGVDVDAVTLDLRPTDLLALARIRDTLQDVLEWQPAVITTESSSSVHSGTQNLPTSTLTFSKPSATDASDPATHYYKDDLRSGAFKIVSAAQLPMAYQVTLYASTVSWRYPHPRAITRLVAYPIPDHDVEIECALELYCPMLSRWEPHTYFKLPVAEPRELQFNIAPNDAVFALMWRVRACSDSDQVNQPFEFDCRKFLPKQDPMASDPPAESDYYKKLCAVTAEQLSGVLRIDSYFAPRLLPRVRVALRLAALELHLHNALPSLPKLTSQLEGYYVSRPLMRSHRALTLSARDSAVHAVCGDVCKLLVDTNLSSDILDSANGTMEQLVEEFRLQGTLTLDRGPRVRVRGGDVRAALNVPRVSTMQSLAGDWIAAYKQFQYSDEYEDVLPTDTGVRSLHDAARALQGRVSLWVHNNCAAALRVGQEGTDEVVPLSAAAVLAYRWRSPAAPKKLRFSIASPSADWHWSTSIPFTAGRWRVRLEGGEGGGSVLLYVCVRDVGARRDMYLSGRLLLANVLRHTLLYKVRARGPDNTTWQTISSGELQAESIGSSVLCDDDCEAVLKVKFTCQEAGWSGDIPLKECRKENVPWLVKVPSEGEVTYTSIWCRVVRARSDGRIVATTWPFYILRSYLPLDIDVYITSDTGAKDTEEAPPSSIIQTAAGRGACTHLLAPGTTSARHALSFQYRNIDCPVTREAVPLHYGVTDNSVFEKPVPVANVEDIINVIQQWLESSSRGSNSGWPYSIVRKHWPGTWRPALLQPRCDVTMRYTAVRAGGGCSLELQLCPLVLLCNASPVALTLRAHDAAPLCKLEPGTAISPPSTVLQKPFFMSVEMGRETFVSGALRVCAGEPGRYGAPPPGHVAEDRAADFAVHCNQKVALLTIYYEIKENINVLGVTSTYILINKLPCEILVSAIAVPSEMEKNSILRPKTYKVVPPTKEGSVEGTPLCRFWVRGRWRGGDADELRAFLCLALPCLSYPTATPVPIRLGLPPMRRAIALRDEDGQSVPVVVTQTRHEGRWLVVVDEDPCPQFVVHNRTRAALAVAQPLADDTQQAVQECSGVRWWCTVEAGAATHYSTPAYCARYPPPANAPALAPVPFLAVGRPRDDIECEWSQPLAIADGEHLLQLTGGVTIKVRVRTHPHSSLVELQDVDQNDISASDIRRRLLGAFIEDSDSNQDLKDTIAYEHEKLHRISADDKLLDRSLPLSSERKDEEEEITLLLPDIQTILSASQVIPEDPTKEEGEIEPKENKLPTDMVIMTADVSSKTDSGKIIEDSANTKENTAEKTGFSDNKDSSLMKLSGRVRDDIEEAYKNEVPSTFVVPPYDSANYSETSFLMEGVSEKEWSDTRLHAGRERARFVLGSVAVTLAAAPDSLPLLALHLQRAALLLQADARKICTTLSIADVQIDNAQYETEEYDFAVVATTRAEEQEVERWPPLWGMFSEVFSTRSNEARLLLRTCHERWTAAEREYNELTEVELRLGPLGLYIEDAYVGAAVELFHLAVPITAQTSEGQALAEIRTMINPLRLTKLHIHPLDLTLTLHTAVRMYIALDESPLRLSAFHLQHAMTSPERLTHALTVHYLSAAILGAGWVVGGLELLGAPGALAARVGGASGGVRGVASAAAAALLRSLSAAAGSLARNLDLLAGDEEHARRAAAARRRPPPSLMAGLVAGITNFAINILGAVGGLAHHPLVGVAVGEGGGASALRRGILGAITKPLSATADLVAYAGHGLLTQTGWDPVPQPRAGALRSSDQWGTAGGWRRDCVRWDFRLAEMSALAGFDTLLDDAPLQLLITHKFLVIAEPESERIVEMIDFKFCSLGPYQGQIIELRISQRKASRISESRIAVDEDNEYQVSAAAMARVARYTGADGGGGEARLLALLPAPGRAPALHAALSAALLHNDPGHHPLL